jgi:nicotinamidase-related amidase
MQELIATAREKGLFLIYVKHVWGDNPSDPQFDIRWEIAPMEQEPVVVKRTPGSFYRTNLEELLKANGIENIIITGMKTNHCCDTTTREASARGYKTIVINDCVRTFDIVGIDGNAVPRETVQYVTLSILQGFAECISFEAFKNIDFD